MITLLSTMNLRKLKILLLYYNNKAVKNRKRGVRVLLFGLLFAIHCVVGRTRLATAWSLHRSFTHSQLHFVRISSTLAGLIYSTGVLSISLHSISESDFIEFMNEFEY